MGRQGVPASPVSAETVSGRPPGPVTGGAIDLTAAGMPPGGRPQFSAADGDFQNLIIQIVDLARELTGASGAAIAFRGEQGTICRATSGVGAPALGVRVDSTEGICKRCLDSGTPLWCEDVATDLRVPEAARAGGIRALAVVPIYVGGHVVGVLAVFSGVPRRFSVLQIRWLQQLAVWVRPAKSGAGKGRGFGSEASLLEAACSEILGSRGWRSNALPSKDSRSELLRWAVGGSEISRSVLRREVGRSNAGIRPWADDRLWNDVFLDTQVPWKRFLESVCLHVVVVGMFAGLAAIWPQEIETTPRMASGAHVTYYPASQAFSAQSFPAYESSRVAAEPRSRQFSADRAFRHARRARNAAEASVDPTTPDSRTPDPRTPDSEKTRAAVMAAPALPNSSGSHGRKAGVDTGVVPPPGGVEARMREARLAKYSVVAPSPEVGGGGLRTGNAPGAAVVAPAPEIGGGAGLRSSSAPREAAVVPAPEVGGGAGLRAGSGLKEAVVAPSVDARGLASGAAGVGRGRVGGGSAEVADIAIVPPAPSLGVHAMVDFGARGPGIGNAEVVGAPPTVEAGSSGIGGSGRSGRNGSLGNGAMQVVPPAPSVAGEGNSVGAGRGGSLAAGVSGSQVVGPPPSVQAGGNFGGRGTGGLGGGSGVVGPAPSAQVGENFGGGRGSGGFGGGSQVVPPAPSAQAGGGFGGGRGNGGLGGGSQVVPPAPSVAGIGGGSSGAGGRGGSIEVARSVGIEPSSAGNGNSSSGDGSSSAGGAGIEHSSVEDASNSAAAENVINLAHRVYQDVQLRVVSLAWAPPRSSYFSNFEVFIAEKWISKKESQFIKLVYVFLPYQRRLSEFGRDALRTRRLRVTRDATCDESLMQIMWSDADHSPVGPGPVGPGAAGPGRAGNRLASPSDRNNALPCYLTTADEYARALVQSQ